MKFRYVMTVTELISGARVRQPFEVEAETQEEADIIAQLITRDVEINASNDWIDALMLGTGDRSVTPVGILHEDGGTPKGRQ